MIRTALCLVMIMTNIVSAEAAFNEFKDSRVEKAAWTATHVGAAQLDGMNVVAALEVAEHEIVLPEMIAGEMQTLVPLAPVKKKVYRMTIVALENSKLKASFALESKVASVDGELRKVYLSAPSEEIRFMITTEADSKLHVRYSKKVNESQSEEGEFFLEPAVQALRK